MQNFGIIKTGEMLRNKEISAKELISFFLKNIEKKNKDINAYLEVFSDTAAQAEKVDELIANGETDDKPLLGVPVAVKDNILIKGKICSAGSRMLENYRAVYDATVITKLKKAGAVLLGRTNMDEFAMGASTENSAYGPTRNPSDLSRVAGGSSGGSAAAVAMDGCLVSLGSDTGGSIRQPSSFCGVVGLNPTYGAVSRYGLIAMASSFDQIGPITKTIEDAEMVFNVIKGADSMDSTSEEHSFNGSSWMTDGKKLRIGILKYDKNGVEKGVNAAMDKAVKIFQQLEADVVEIDLPNIRYSVPCYYILVPAEVSSNLARFDGMRYGLFKEGKNLTDDYAETRAAGFGTEVRRRIMLGTYVLSAGYYDDYYIKAQKVMALIKNDFQKCFNLDNNGVHLIISPTSPTTAFKAGERASDPLKMYMEDIFTAPAKIAGLPAISVPSGFDSSGLPIGLQIIAPRFGENLLFAAGKKYEVLAS